MYQMTQYLKSDVYAYKHKITIIQSTILLKFKQSYLTLTTNPYTYIRILLPLLMVLVFVLHCWKDDIRF